MVIKIDDIKNTDLQSRFILFKKGTIPNSLGVKGKERRRLLNIITNKENSKQLFFIKLKETKPMIRNDMLLIGMVMTDSDRANIMRFSNNLLKLLSSITDKGITSLAAEINVDDVEKYLGRFITTFKDVKIDVEIYLKRPPSTKFIKKYKVKIDESQKDK